MYYVAAPKGRQPRRSVTPGEGLSRPPGPPGTWYPRAFDTGRRPQRRQPRRSSMTQGGNARPPGPPGTSSSLVPTPQHSPAPPRLTPTIFHTITSHSSTPPSTPIDVEPPYAPPKHHALPQKTHNSPPNSTHPGCRLAPSTPAPIEARKNTPAPITPPMPHTSLPSRIHPSPTIPSTLLEDYRLPTSTAPAPPTSHLPQSPGAPFARD